jgi:hypothetical protein
VGGVAQLAYSLSSTIETNDDDRKLFFPVAFGGMFEDANKVLTE